MIERTKIERVGGHLLIGDAAIPITSIRAYSFTKADVPCCNVWSDNDAMDDAPIVAHGWTAREILEVAYGGGEWLHHPKPSDEAKVKNEEIAELQEQNKSLKAALWSAEHAMIDAVEHLDHGERDEARGLLVDHPKKMVGQIHETEEVGR